MTLQNRLRPLLILVTLLIVGAVFGHGNVSAAGTLTFNDVVGPGITAAVWTGETVPVPAATVADAAARQQRTLSLGALWMLDSGQWRYYLPAFPSTGTLQQVPPTAALYVFFKPPTSDPVGPPTAQTIVTGLNIPWEMAFLPDGRIWVTERAGLVRAIENGRLLAEPVVDLRGVVAANGESGLLGMALDPAFAQNGRYYLYHTYQSGGSLRNRVVRLTESGGASSLTVILDGIPGASIHDGGRLAFGPDGKLYVTTGDATQTNLAQDRGSLAGKILRINADGTVPADSPFSGSPVYSYGHRNVQGLAWHPDSGQLYATEHGPTGNDEVNLIQAGSNYGWPTVSGASTDSRFSAPITAYSPSIAPSGMAIYAASRFPCWRGDLFFGTLAGSHLHRIHLEFGSWATVQSEQRLFDGDFGRLRAVAVGPDGYLYALTNNRDGRGSPSSGDDRLLRVSVSCS